MTYCEECALEYDDPSLGACPHCGSLLEPGPMPSGEDPVVVLEADSVVQAQIVEATLEAEGIPAYVQAPGSLVPGVDPSGDEPPELEVLVAADDLEAAEAVLSEAPLTEEELDAVQQADTTIPPGV